MWAISSSPSPPPQYRVADLRHGPVLVTLRNTTAPLAVNHHGQFPSMTISFNVKRNAPLGPAEAAVNETIAALHLPSTIQPGFQGNAQAFQASLSSEPMLIPGGADCGLHHSGHAV